MEHKKQGRAIKYRVHLVNLNFQTFSQLIQAEHLEGELLQNNMMEVGGYALRRQLLSVRISGIVETAEGARKNM